MTSLVQDAPINDPVVDSNGKAKKTWIFYFNQLSSGDNGTAFTPVASNLTGAFTLSGRYFKNSGFIDLWVTIDPSTSSTSTFGTTYIELPFDATIANQCCAVYGTTVLFGIIDPTTNRMYLPTWAAIAQVVTVTARVFIK